ncbi:MAG TPA: condensation domain-containing protein, partial [Longimicrobium sp.]|nr:condensation domain-containing protein [Longimicrobium sp.]
MPLALRLAGPLDVHALELSLNEIVRRHEVLRTRFAESEGVPVQVIGAAEGVRLEAEELAGGEAELGRRRAEEIARPFDLAVEIPLRARLWRMAEDEHVLLVCVHHIATDGWSVGILFRELSALYAAFAAGRPSPLQEPRVQYADYAVWQRSHLSRQRMDGQRAYWRARLEGAAALELPTDRPRPALQGFRGGAVPFRLPNEVADGLRALARAERCTPFAVLLAAWNAMLARYTGQDDIVVGSPIAGRTRPELEGVAGFFVNTLALRTDLGGDPTFRELLARVKETTLGAYQHQELPFEQLVEELAPRRSLSRNPLFQVMFALQNLAMEPLALPGMEVRPLAAPTGATRFDVEIHVTRTDPAPEGLLVFDADLFDASTASRMCEHYEILLREMLSAPDRRISEPVLLAPSEYDIVLACDPPASQRTECVHALFSAQAERTPDAIALEFAGEHLTYAELDNTSTQMAHSLLRKGVHPEERVGVHLERGTALAVAVLGVLKAGACYVPLDPAHPPDRLAFVARDAGVKVVIGDHLPPALAAQVTRVGVDGTGDGPLPAVHPGNLAYVLYTSGSTGRPKGVAMPHEPLVNLLRWHRDHPALGRPARTLQFAPAGFDVAFQEIFSAWCTGGTVVMVGEETRRDPRRLARFLAEREI